MGPIHCSPNVWHATQAQGCKALQGPFRLHRTSHDVHDGINGKRWNRQKARMNALRTLRN
eukprot:6472209-Amphidinium_carterae.3